MEPINSTAARAMRTLLANQPTTDAKVAFAWQIAAGPALGRSASVRWADEEGVLHVRPSTPAWTAEIRHARPILRGRMNELLGADVVKRIEIVPASERPPRASNF
jgi:hypothetical protein